MTAAWVSSGPTVPCPTFAPVLLSELATSPPTAIAPATGKPIRAARRRVIFRRAGPAPPRTGVLLIASARSAIVLVAVRPATSASEIGEMRITGFIQCLQVKQERELRGWSDAAPWRLRVRQRACGGRGGA